MKADFKRKKIPMTKASKYLVAMNPHSTHSSAVKSFNASATKSSAKATIGSGFKAQVAAHSAFLAYEANTTPQKRSRVDSCTFG